MSKMKRYAEQVSEEMGLGGEINDSVLFEVDRRLKMSTKTISIKYDIYQSLTEALQLDHALPGAGRNEKLGDFTVEFDGGYSVNVRVSNNGECGPWSEAILWHDGCEVDVTDGSDYLGGEWHLEHEDRSFTVIVERGPCIELDETERGNTWLVYEDGDRQYFLADLGGDTWLETTINPANYPGFTVRTITGSKDKMVAHIQEEWVGAFARKCNLEVKLDSTGHVVDLDDLDNR